MRIVGVLNPCGIRWADDERVVGERASPCSCTGAALELEECQRLEQQHYMMTTDAPGSSSLERRGSDGLASSETNPLAALCRCVYFPPA